MRSATRITAAAFGLAAGIAGLEHGYFEVLQGNTQPAGLMIVSMGPPCVPEQVWNACEPALSVIPNFLGAGLLSLVVGLIIMVWSVAFVQRQYGGWGLIGLSVLLLLVGGGLFPPLIGIVGGVAATQINKPVEAGRGSGLVRASAALWPWPLVIFMVWVWGQFLFGYFFNDLLKSLMGLGVLLIVTMLPLSVYCAYARDMQHPVDSPQAG